MTSTVTRAIAGLRRLPGLAGIPDHPLYRVALLCGLAPLVSGVAIFLLWLMVRSRLLAFMGIVTIYAGVASVIVGLACLAAYTVKSNEPKRRVWTAYMAALVLLLGNFPCAAVIVTTVVWIETAYCVTVVNESSTTISQFALQYPGKPIEFGPIAPGVRKTRNIRPNSDGALKFVATRNGERLSDTISGYVTGNMQGDARVTFRPDGTWEIEQSFAD